MSTKTYAAALRNLVAIAVALNGVLSLMVYAILSTETIASGANILSVLAEVAAGRWLRIVVVVDAVGVLLGGVLTGVLTADGLIGRLTRYVVDTTSIEHGLKLYSGIECSRKFL